MSELDFTKRFGKPEDGSLDALEGILERGWQAFAESDLAQALSAAGEALRRFPDSPEAWLLLGSCRVEAGEPGSALDALERGRQAEDGAFFHLYRALALYDLGRTDEARADLEEALELDPERGEAHHFLAIVLEDLGQQVAARAHYEHAHRIDPDLYGFPLPIGDEEFDRIVERALIDLPDPVREKLREVPVLVEVAPSPELLQAHDPPLTPDLLGLFVGRSLLERSHADSPGPPEAIYLFRRNLLRFCRDRQELALEIRVTVQHEVGHLLGADEERLDDWGLA